MIDKQFLPDDLQIGCPPSLYNDDKLIELGTFLQNRLNTRLKEYFTVPELQAEIINSIPPDQLEKLKAVNTIQIGDLPYTSQLEFPILKLYRISSNWKKYKYVRETYIGIMYGLNYPILKILPGFLNWIDVYMNLALEEYQYQQNQLNPIINRDLVQDIQTTYSLLRNATTDEILYSLRWTFRIRES